MRSRVKAPSKTNASRSAEKCTRLAGMPHTDMRETPTQRNWIMTLRACLHLQGIAPRALLLA